MRVRKVVGGVNTDGVVSPDELKAARDKEHAAALRKRSWILIAVLAVTAVVVAVAVTMSRLCRSRLA
jgi:hypothetical protein